MTQRLSSLADTLMWPAPAPLPSTTLPHTVTVSTDLFWILIPLAAIGGAVLLETWVFPVWECARRLATRLSVKWFLFWMKHT